MPFNIELSKISNGVFIKVQAVKNTITVYFNGPETAAEEAGSNWVHLEGHFLKTLPGFNPDWVRGPDAPHIKKNHTNHSEVPIVHYHREFSSEITPELFARYLNNFFEQQINHHESKYQFFIDRQEVVNMQEAYGIYYRNYKGSRLEEIYEDETTLSTEEQLEYSEAVQEHQQEKQLESLVNSLLIASIISGDHPLFRMPSNSRFTAPVEEATNEMAATNPTEDSTFDCTIM